MGDDLLNLATIRRIQAQPKRGKPVAFFVVIDPTGEPCLEFQCVFCNKIHNLPIKNRNSPSGHHGFTITGDPASPYVDERIKILLRLSSQMQPFKCEFFLRNGEQILID